MEDLTGLMAPIPTQARAEYEKRRRREEERRRRMEGPLGLLAAIAEPLTYVPKPLIGVPATLARNVAEEGLLTGLLRSWDEFLPSVRTAKGVLNVFKRADKQASPADVRRIAREGITSPEAEKFYKRTGTFIDAAGNTLEEIPDSRARLTDMYLNKLAELILKQRRRASFSSRLHNLLWHPDLYHKFPQAKNIELTVEYNPSKSGGSFDPRRGEIEIITGSDFGEGLSSIIHELTHYLQNLEGLPHGYDPKELQKTVEDLITTGQLQLPQWVLNLDPDRQKTVRKVLANKLYYLTEGELMARTAEERRRLRQSERMDLLPTLGGAAPIQNADIGLPEGVKTFIPQEFRLVDPQDPDAVARIAAALLRFP